MKMAKSESKSKLNVTRLPTPLLKHPSSTNVLRPLWDSSIVPKQGQMNSKKTPLKSAIDVLVAKMDQLDGQAGDLSKVAENEKSDLLVRYSAFQSLCLAHVENFQTEFLYLCNKVRDMSFVQRNKLTKVIEGEDKKLETVTSANTKDDITRLNMEFQKFSTLKTLTKSWESLERRGIIRKSDIQRILDELEKFRKETVFKSDIRTLRDKLCQMQQSLVPKIELVTFCDKLESFHSDVITKSLMQTFNQEYDQLSRSLSTTIGSRPTCQSIVHIAETLEDTTKRLGLELRKLNMQINNEQTGSQEMVKGDGNTVSKVKLACDHYLRDELLDIIVVKLEDDLKMRKEYSNSIKFTIEEATERLVTKQDLKKFEKLLETQKQGNMKQLLEHVKEAEEKCSKLDLKNTESKLSRIVYILKQLNDGKVNMDVGKAQDEKASGLCSKIAADVEVVKEAINEDCAKTLDDLKKGLVDKCNFHTTDIIQKVTEATESEIRKNITVTGRDPSSKERDSYTMDDLKQAVDGSMDKSLASIDDLLEEGVSTKLKEVKETLYTECETIKQMCKDDLVSLCKTIKDGLNESLETANKNLMVNFEKFRAECEVMHNKMKAEIIDSVKLFRKQLPLLLNHDSSATENM